MAITTNAIANVTIQDQDLLTPTQPVIVSRSNVQVVLPATNVTYSGYLTVTSVTAVSLNLPAGVAFLYVRNASLVSNNNLVQLSITPVTQPATLISIPGGGVFLYACPIAGTNNLAQIASASVQGNTTQPVQVEYMWGTAF